MRDSDPNAQSKRLVSISLLLLVGTASIANAMHAQELVFPSGLTIDPEGMIVVADRGAHYVFRIDPVSGSVTPIIGTGEPGYAGDGGPARNAAVRAPEWVEFDRSGNLYLADRANHVIRLIDAESGIISTIVGTGTEAHGGDGGPATDASITNPFGLTLDTDGNLFIFDTEAHAVRRVDASTGIITTVIGSTEQGFSGDGGPATAATLFRPHNGVFDSHGRLVLGDSFNQRIRRWDPVTGVIETIAGIGERGTSPEGTPAADALFWYFGAMAYDMDGNLVFTSLDERILRINVVTNQIEVVAGTGTEGFGEDGEPATQAQLSTPYGMAMMPNGDIVFSDAGNRRVRLVERTSGLIRTIAGGDPH